MTEPAYALRVDMLGLSLPLEPHVYRAGYVAALHECKSGALTWRAPHSVKYVLRCGKRVGARLCLRPRDHRGFCWYERDDSIEAALSVDLPKKQEEVPTWGKKREPKAKKEAASKAAKPRGKGPVEGQGSLF
jgi:hypothetical protein